jgi:ubiquinone/menaquinone biosynthesis C-methylase UbiE
MTRVGRYGAGLLGHDRPTELRRLRLREQVMDPTTRRIIAARGLRSNWHCLELGAGTGSVARWLAARCREGRVVATDLDLRHLGEIERPNLEVRRHDVVGEDFPDGSFDLVYARSLLVNLPDRERVLSKVVRWLAPGGWAVLEEPAMVFHDRSPHPAFRRLFCAYECALELSHGADIRWASRLPALLASAGLRDVGALATPQLVGDGGAADAIWRTALEQAREQMLRLRLLTEHELEAGFALLDDASFLELAMLLISTWGRKPAPRGGAGPIAD